MHRLQVSSVVSSTVVTLLAQQCVVPLPVKCHSLLLIKYACYVGSAGPARDVQEHTTASNQFDVVLTGTICTEYKGWIGLCTQLSPQASSAMLTTTIILPFQAILLRHLEISCWQSSPVMCTSGPGVRECHLSVTFIILIHYCHPSFIGKSLAGSAGPVSLHGVVLIC